MAIPFNNHDSPTPVKEVFLVRPLPHLYWGGGFGQTPSPSFEEVVLVRPLPKPGEKIYSFVLYPLENVALLLVSFWEEVLKHFS